MFSVILQSMQILLSILSVIGHLICGHWQQLELASELESDLRNSVDWGKNWLVDFNAGKTQLILFDWSNNNGFIDVKMDGSVLRKNHLLRCWGWPSLLNWIEIPALSLLLKLPPRKLELLIRSMKFLSPEVALYLFLFQRERKQHAMRDLAVQGIL